jgi:hypothetical protein
MSLDTALNNALNSMSSSELKTYTSSNAQNAQDTLTNNFANAFAPNLKNVNAASADYNAMSNYTIQSKNLNTVVGDLSQQQSTNLNIAGRNNSTAGRTREIKEWYYNNKLDTLFVFQLIFIGLCLLAVIAMLAKLGFLSNAIVGILMGILIIALILIITNRAIYTEKVRDKRYWSKRMYGVVGSPLPGGIMPTKCP